MPRQNPSQKQKSGRKDKKAKVKQHGTREEVWDGKAKMTRWGLTKKKLMIRRGGRIMSVAEYSKCKKRGDTNLMPWRCCLLLARDALDIDDHLFVPLQKGTPLYIKARSFYDLGNAEVKRLILDYFDKMGITTDGEESTDDSWSEPESDN